MKDLAPFTDAHRRQLEAERPFIWLYEIEKAGDPPTRYRLTNFTEQVAFGVSSGGDRRIYSPAPIVHGPIEEGSDGSLPKFTFTIANAGAIMASTVDGENGFVEQPVRLILISAYELANPDAAIIEQGEIESCSITSSEITFAVTAFNLFELQYPAFLYARRRCRYETFGGAECGYNANASGAGFSSCPKTLEACEERGDDEEARGLARQHPARFGGFPGVPRAGRG